MYHYMGSGRLEVLLVLYFFHLYLMEYFLVTAYGISLVLFHPIEHGAGLDIVYLSIKL